MQVPPIRCGYRLFRYLFYAAVAVRLTRAGDSYVMWSETYGGPEADNRPCGMSICAMDMTLRPLCDRPTTDA